MDEQALILVDLQNDFWWASLTSPVANWYRWDPMKPIRLLLACGFSLCFASCEKEQAPPSPPPFPTADLGK
jgi:hypothetical protein